MDWLLSTEELDDWLVELSTEADWDCPPLDAPPEELCPWLTDWSVLLLLDDDEVLVAEFDWSTDPPPPPPTEAGAETFDCPLVTDDVPLWVVVLETTAC